MRARSRRQARKYLQSRKTGTITNTAVNNGALATSKREISLPFKPINFSEACVPASIKRDFLLGA